MRFLTTPNSQLHLHGKPVEALANYSLSVRSGSIGEKIDLHNGVG